MGRVRSLDSSLVVSGPQLSERGVISISTRRLLFLVWMSIGVAPLLLQARSYLRFLTPHKISRSLLPPDMDVKNTTDLLKHCPVEGLFIAGIWWNVVPAHYYPAEDGVKYNAIKLRERKLPVFSLFLPRKYRVFRILRRSPRDLLR
ncbi:hypothetical protein F443_06530 [Phytophthora nicotianae P1569]|uniref:Uncharacterized protein n=1 Tax=Phytophthora nicotianae P1569 TaxID=1317065 RepID=V9FE63_PHYNI|nr:hypothetical protein F443_06530 [Phytophthora nicotianae P1569]